MLGLVDFSKRVTRLIRFIFPQSSVELKPKYSQIPQAALMQSHFAKLPDELFVRILAEMPKDCYVGSFPINQVCYYWDNLIKREVVKQKPTEIVKACQSREDALRILKNRDLCNQFSTDEFFSVVSWVSEIAGFLVKTSKLLDMTDVGKLCAHDIDLAKWAIENKKTSKKRYGFCRGNVTKSYLIKSERRRMVAESNLEIAAEILSVFREQYANRDYEPKYISKLMLSLAVHPELQDEILSTPEYCQLLDREILGDLLMFLAAKNVRIAQYLLTTPQQSLLLEPMDLICLMSLHPQIEALVLASEEKKAYLHDAGFVDLQSKVQEMRLHYEETRKQVRPIDKAWYDHIKPKLDEALVNEASKRKRDSINIQ